MLHGDSAGKTSHKIERYIDLHLIAKPHAYSRSRLAGVMAATRDWTELHHTVNNVMRPHILYERHRFARKSIHPALHDTPRITS